MENIDMLEVREGSTYTFTHFIESKNTPIVPTTANISIYSKDGSTILSSTAMTIAAPTGICTYAWDSTGIEVGTNYIVKYELDSYNHVIRIFDIMKYPFINNVTDDDLFAEYKGLKTNLYETSSNAQSGTTSTIVDKNRFERDDHWNGGVIEIYQNKEIYVRKITDFVLSTNTITFSPTIPNAITTESYTIRQSFQDDINYAGNNVQLHFKNLEKRAYLIVDSYTVKKLIVYEVLKQYFFENMKETNDEYGIKYKHYADKYKTLMESMKLVYDLNEDGIINTNEENSTVGKIVWYR